MGGITDINDDNITIQDGQGSGERVHVDSDNALKVKIKTGAGLETVPSQSGQVNFDRIILLLQEQIKQMRILNTYMALITDDEKIEIELGDDPII